MGLIHGLYYLGCTWLAGLFFFRAWIAPDSKRAKMERALHSKLAIASGLAALVWFVLKAAEVADSWAPSELSLVASSTRFGNLALAQVGVIGLLWGASRWLPEWIGAFLSLPLLILIAYSGHAGASPEGLWLSLGLDLSHLVAVALWTGGLFGLILWLKRGLNAPLPEAFAVVTRFSRVAAASTGIIAITGLVIALRSGVAPTAPWVTDYGKWVLVKLGLFCAVMLAASLNHFVHLRGWDRRRGSPNADEPFIRAIYREARVELVGILLIFMAAGFLTLQAAPHAMPGM